MSVTFIILLTFLAQAAPLTPDPQAKAHAQELLGQGSKLYQQGDVTGALEKFEAAYVAFPSPKLMFNIGQANRDLGRPVEAIEAFQRFLAEATDASPEKMADARRFVAELQMKLGKLRIDCDTPGAEVSVDGKTVGRTPLPGLIWATPGRHQVTASRADAVPALETVEAQTGSTSTVTIHLIPLVAPAPAPVAMAPAPTPVLQTAPPVGPSPSSANEGWWLGRKWTWVAAGSTVLLAAGAITTGVLMKSKFDSLRTSCGAGNPDRPGCTQSDIDSVTSRQTMANVFWALAGAAAVTTGVLFFVEGRAVSVAPVAGAGGTTGLIAAVRY
jgi:hypothetical protein